MRAPPCYTADGQLLFATDAAPDGALLFTCAQNDNAPCYSPDGHLLFAENRAIDAALIFACGLPEEPGTDSHPSATAHLALNLPALTLQAVAGPPLNVHLTLSLPPLTQHIQAAYRSNVQRPVTGQCTAHEQQAGAHITSIQHRSAKARTQHQHQAAHWQSGTQQISRLQSRRLRTRVRAPQECVIHHQTAARSGTATHPSHAQAQRLHLDIAQEFAAAQRIEALHKALAHQDGWRDRRFSSCQQHQDSQRHSGLLQRTHILSAHALRLYRRTQWQIGMRPPPGRHPSHPWDPPSQPACYTANGQLLFTESRATDGALIFICGHLHTPTSSPSIPIRRTYTVINDITLQRWPDSIPIPVLELSLSLDTDSWAWGFDARLPLAAQELLMPTEHGPVELIATLNGTVFHMLAENLSREREFGNASIRLSGRGRSALLAAPYAPVNSFANSEQRSAQQLMEDILTVNGIPLGWTVDWGLTDWQVPAGCFAKQGTWIEALSHIAAAAGGYVLPHPSEKILHIRHRYPVAPWHWWIDATPDIVLPVDIMSRESLRWIDKPAYNRVFVSGQDHGVLGQVTRSTTAGDQLAPMVVDALITEAAAARQRGTAILSDTGRQLEITLRLPVLPETGIIQPGTLVAYQDSGEARLGIVRSTRLDAALPDVWQTLGVQSHV